ncbi:MAG TPA: ABC transporter ATP-binding protein [Candidatus Sulfotelmatobacter sp.]|nr:ABC transporter ATP-binding protein [Candidatus Sulfotelmatobacter sp.]
MRNILKIIAISKPLHGLVVILSILILTSSVLDLITPILSKFIIDDIVANVQTKSGNLNHLILLIAISFVASFLSLVLTTISDRLGDHTAGKLRKFLTEKFYHKVLTLPQSYFDSELSGKIVNQLNRGIQSIQDFINTSSNFILPAILQSIFTVIVLAFYNIPIAIFTFLLFPIYMLISYHSTVQWGLREVEKNKIEDVNKGRIQEVISNIPLVKSFNNELNEYKTVSKNLKEINEIYAKQSTTYHIFDFFRGLSLNIVLLLISIVVFYNAFKGALSLGEVVLILQLVAQARRPLFAMSFILTRVQTAESGSKEFFQILNLTSSESFEEEKNLKKTKDATIEFKNVYFRYTEEEKVLENVSFKINKHEKVALVGHSGAGKTTIINLILKFYSPTKGDLFFKNTSYQKLDHGFIRNNISLVFQDNELFSSTVRENVAYGKNEATDDEIINALKLANAYEFVEKLPKGVESTVGERGVKLSGGQKQRIQIARAILKDSPILILDEATSSLDAKSEKEVQNALEYLMKNRLVIIIAHRFSTIQNVDKVIVVDEGKIVDSGNPQELSKKKGIYSELLHYQIEGNKRLLEKFDLQ